MYTIRLVNRERPHWAPLFTGTAVDHTAARQVATEAAEEILADVPQATRQAGQLVIHWIGSMTQPGELGHVLGTIYTLEVLER